MAEVSKTKKKLLICFLLISLSVTLLANHKLGAMFSCVLVLLSAGVIDDYHGNVGFGSELA